MRRILVAQYSLTGCEGCAVNLVNVIARNPMILEYIEIVDSRIMGIHSENIEKIDIAFIDGSVVTKHDEEVVRKVREKANTVVALGTCACIGGVNVIKDLIGHSEASQKVYLKAPNIPHLSEAKALHEVIKVDYMLPGCPAFRDEIELFFMHVLLGKTFRLTDRTVCHDCKALGLPCLLERGMLCLGPLTRGGCDALCIQYNNACWGCRGLAEEPKFDKFLEAVKEHKISLERLKHLIVIFLSKTKAKSLMGEILE